MDLRRLRPFDWLALVASVALLVLLALEWFAVASSTADVVQLSQTSGEALVPSPDGSGDLLSTTGYGALGWLCVALLVLSALGGLILAVATALRTTSAFAVAAQVLTTPLAILSALVLLVVLLFQPSLGSSLPNDEVMLRWPAYAGLAAAIVLPFAVWRSMADERTTARSSAFTPPPARPAPPRGPATTNG